MLFSPLLSFYFHLFHFHPLFPFWKSALKKNWEKGNYILHDILLVALYFLLNVADVHFKGSPEKNTFLYFELDKGIVQMADFQISNVYRFINNSLGKPQKKSSSLNGRANKWGGGVKFRTNKEKELFFNLFSKVPTFQKFFFGLP